MEPKLAMAVTGTGDDEREYTIHGYKRMLPHGVGKPVLYFIAETKESPNLGTLRNIARRKIECAAAHFGRSSTRRKGRWRGWIARWWRRRSNST
jgi:hypothetical protein